MIDSKNLEKITKENAKDKLFNLAKTISYHDDLYYNKNRNEISDSEYDKLRELNKKLEHLFPDLIQINSPSKRVGSKLDSNLQKIKHNAPMLSLNNGYNQNDLKEFYNKTKKALNYHNSSPVFIAETKVDGLSASIRYKDGKIDLALTRGDGRVGEDITKNIKYVDGVVFKLPRGFPKYFEIRGEIYMPNDVFANLNKERKKIGLTSFSTPRNAASGSMRQLDPLITASRKLGFYCYSVINPDKSLGITLSDIKNNVKEKGFIVNEPYEVFNNIESMINFYNDIQNKRSKLNYDIDGIVYKLDRLDEQVILGDATRWPRWAIALKFPAEAAITEVLDIIVQVGRTGVLTPVAILKEVNIGGVRVNRATLHNEDEIDRIEVRKGDRVTLQRAGDVIPKILSVDLKSRKENSEKYIFPIKCPSCGTDTKRLKGEANRRCLNINHCQEQLISKFSHFVSRDAFDINGLGEKQLKFLLRKSFITEFFDIFLLEKKIKEKNFYLLNIMGWGEKSINNLLNAINSRRNIELYRLIYSLGIRHVGRETANLLSENYKTIQELIDVAKRADSKLSKSWVGLNSINGIGDSAINSLYDYFSDVKNITSLERLLIELDIKNKIQIKSKGIFSNKNLLFTGKISSMTRKEAIEKAESKGAKILKVINKNLDILIVGKDAGSKLEKAKRLKVRILTEKEFIDIVNND